MSDNEIFVFDSVVGLGLEGRVILVIQSHESRDIRLNIMSNPVKLSWE